MATDLEKRDAKGRFVNDPGPGRPRKGHALRDLLKRVPVAEKRRLVAIAYAMALDGDVHWAEWIAKHSGESGSRETDGDLTINVDNRQLIVYHNGDEE